MFNVDYYVFFFIYTANTEIYTYLHTRALHDALPIARSLSGIPASKRGKHVGQMLAFPLPGERKIKGLERDWPEFSDEFRHTAVSVERPAGTWDRRKIGRAHV